MFTFTQTHDSNSKTFFFYKLKTTSVETFQAISIFFHKNTMPSHWTFICAIFSNVDVNWQNSFSIRCRTSNSDVTKNARNYEEANEYNPSDCDSYSEMYRKVTLPKVAKYHSFFAVSYNIYRFLENKRYNVLSSDIF